MGRVRKSCAKRYTKLAEEKPRRVPAVATTAHGGGQNRATPGGPATYFLPLGRTSSSLADGRKLPFQTSSALTRVLVPKASNTRDAIRDRRGTLTRPKASARASGL